jgi:lipoprotein-anchoring transpeptidase ErfK/SrfK
VAKRVGRVASKADRGGLSILHLVLLSGVAAAFVASLASPAEAQSRRSRYISPYFGYYYGSVGTVAPRRARQRSDTSRKAEAKKEHPSFGEMPKGPLQIIVSIGSQKVTLYSNGVRVAQGGVSTGVPGHPTPLGVFSVIEKDRYHHSNIYSGAPMPFMQRITWSGIALHEGVLPGHPASHGCIRMSHDFAQKLWPITKLGVRVIVARPELSPVDFTHDKLFVPKPKPAGSDVAMNEPIRLAQVIDATKQGVTVVDVTPIEGDPTPAPAADQKPEAAPAPAEVASPNDAGKPGEAAVQTTEAPVEAVVKSTEAPAEAAVKSIEAPVEAAVTSTEAAPEPAPEGKAADEPVTATGAVPPTAPAEADAAPVELRKAVETPQVETPTPVAAEPKPEVVEPKPVVAEPKPATAEPKPIAAEPKPAEAVPAVAAPASTEPAKPEPSLVDPPKPIAPRIKAADQPKKRTGQIAVFVSRKEKKIFVRQGFVPLFDMPITIDSPEHPLGTHVFTAMGATEDGSGMRWNLITVPSAQAPVRESSRDRRRRGRSEPAVHVPVSTKEPSSAAEALDRIHFPPEAVDRISELLIPGSSLVVSDEGLGRETGRGTDFVVLTR